MAFDILTRMRSHGLPYLVDGAYWLIGVGLVGALLAAVFGLLDLFTIPRATRAFTIGVTHLVLNATVAVVFVIGFAWRAGDHLELDKTPWGQLALSAVAVAVLGVSMWLGGTSTYRYGARGSDETTQAEGFRTRP